MCDTKNLFECCSNDTCGTQSCKWISCLLKKVCYLLETNYDIFMKTTDKWWGGREYERPMDSSDIAGLRENVGDIALDHTCSYNIYIRYMTIFIWREHQYRSLDLKLLNRLLMTLRNLYQVVISADWS